MQAARPGESDHVIQQFIRGGAARQAEKGLCDNRRLPALRLVTPGEAAVPTGRQRCGRSGVFNR